MNELTVKVTQNGEIIFNNFDEIKRNLAEKMSEYKGAIFTDESIPIAKKEVASLRKLAKEVDGRRKEVKAAYMQPYNDFESKVKEITGLINEPITLIDEQVKDFEERRKQEKRNEIEEIYNSLVGEVSAYLPLQKIYNPKWENATTKLKAISAEIERAVMSTEQAIQAIKAMNSEAVPKALEQYKSDLSLANAITYINQYEQQKAEILRKEQERKQQEEERKKQAEIDRIRREERERIAEEERIKEEERKKVITEQETKKQEEKAAMEIQNEQAGETVSIVNIKVTGYQSEIDQVRMYMDSIGVDYEISFMKG